MVKPIKVVEEAEEKEEEEKEEKEEEKEKEEEEELEKKKKPRSQKQIETFEKARTKMLANHKARHETQKRMEEDNKTAFEGKIMKKALEIKKKQILKESMLDEVSDEDTDIQKIKRIVKAKSAKVEKALAKVEKGLAVIYV